MPDAHRGEDHHAANGPMPRAAMALLAMLLPVAEREEVVGDLGAEYRDRRRSRGRARAWLWLWRQVLASAPLLARRGWWRGWNGFETDADRLRPGGAMFEGLARDVRYALRRLRSRPMYAALTVTTLALGVAGTAAVYGITRKVLLEPLPLRDEAEVVVLWSHEDWSESEFAYIRPDVEGFRSLAAVRHADATLIEGDAPARMIPGLSATAELFDVLGARPLLGRTFQAGDDAVGAEPVVVLSHALWRDLGGDPGIIGRRIVLGGVTRTVVGVMPKGFWYPTPDIRVWLAEEVDPGDRSGNYTLLGRMVPGARIADMAPPLARMAARLRERYRYPDQWDKTKNPTVTSLRDDVIGEVRPSLMALLAAMGAILLIACVNVAALTLGQVDGRGTELAVRRALGAGGSRLVRQLLVESLVTGVLAGVAGALLAAAGFPFLTGALPLGALAETATLDWSVFVTSLAVSMAAATAVALVPAVVVGRAHLRDALTRARTSGVGARGGRLEGLLVIAQAALVLLMTSGAVLLVRSVRNLRAIDTGVTTADVAVMDIVVPTGTGARGIPATVRDAEDAVASLPGVESAAVTQRLPLRGSGHNWGIAVEGQPELATTTTAFRVVTPGYFETMGIRVLSGRGLLETDRGPPSGEGVVVINQALADKYFPGVDPIGRRIGFMNARWDRIVGVVANVAEAGLTDDPVPARYMVYEQVPSVPAGQTIVFRVAKGRAAAATLEAARHAVQTRDPAVAVREMTTMDNVLTRAIGPAVQVMSLLALLGALALILGVVGVYGVVSHFVTRRRRDYGIRLALGMRPRLLIGEIVGRGGVLVGAGIALGLMAFVATARVLTTFLYGVSAIDGLSLAAAAAVLLIAGIAAASVPAMRAARIDPARVLREQ